MSSVVVRDTTTDDLPTLFEFLRDPESRHMAAFTTDDPNDGGAFRDKWTRLIDDGRCVTKTVLVDGDVAGVIVVFVIADEHEISYWMDRRRWGRGVAGHAVAKLLRLVTVRPVFARVAEDNTASTRVLERNGFTMIGKDRSFAAARGQEITELIYRLG